MGRPLSSFAPTAPTARAKKEFLVLHAFTGHAASPNGAANVRENKGLQGVPADSRPPRVAEVGKGHLALLCGAVPMTRGAWTARLPRGFGDRL